MHLHDNSHHQSSSQSPSLLQGSRLRSISSGNHNQQHNIHTPLYSSAHSGGIRKKPTSSFRNRAVSTSYAERLHHFALEQSTLEADYTHQHQQSLEPESNLNWLTPQHSPEPSSFFQQEPIQLDQQFQWAAPTPPHSDSGIPTLSADVTEDSQQPVCSGISSPDTFAFDPVTADPDMSSLGYLLPQQYASGAYTSESNNDRYSMDSGYPARTQPTTSASQYGQTISSSPSLYQSRPVSTRRQSDLAPHSQMYSGPSRRITGPYDSPAQSDYSMPQSQGMPPMSGMSTASPMASPIPTTSGIAPAYTRSPAMYDSQYYGPAYTTAPGASQMYAPAPSSSYPPPFTGSSADSAGRADMRGMAQKPKAQCFDHGCNGRQFSTFSNLLRHQREKSGNASKSYCPKCGAEFTRTTARNGHLAHDKCTKATRPSEDRIM